MSTGLDWRGRRCRAVLVTFGAGWAGYGALGNLANPRQGTTELLAEITRWVPMP